MAKLLKNVNDADVSVMQQNSTFVKPNLKGDWLNFFLLMLLYIMQGFPFGLSTGLPLIFQSKKLVTYEEQALFSFVLWPYSMKIIWAPLVDALYIQRIGRRKTWLISVMYLMGLFLIFMAYNVESWMPEMGKPNFKMIVCVLFIINYLSAIQDIVVDGWALTMLKKKNVSYASTCNCIGVGIGIFIGLVSLCQLTSEEFCNKFLRFTPRTGGIVSLKSFLYFWATVFVFITTLVTIFKKEKNNKLEYGYRKINVLKMYKLIYDLIMLPNIRLLLIGTLTSKIGFAATDAVASLKLIDAGVSKDDLMIISIVMFGVSGTTGLLVSKYIAGLRPLSIILKVIPIRLLWSLVYAALVYYTPVLIKKDGVINVPIYYYILLGFIFTAREVMSYIMMASIFAFFSRISDPRVGGTYMTLLNSVNSLSWMIPNTLALKMVDFLTFKKCSNGAQNNCSTEYLNNTCHKIVDNCFTIVDGYYVEVLICLAIGLIWCSIFISVFKKLEVKNPSYWLVNLNPTDTENTNIPSII